MNIMFDDKASDKPLILEQVNIDLNKLFSLSYTFDNLKSFISSISKNQSLMSEKINELEDKLKQQVDINKKYQENIMKIDKKLVSIESKITKSFKKEKKQKLPLYNKNKEIEKDSADNINKESKEEKQENQEKDINTDEKILENDRKVSEDRSEKEKSSRKQSSSSKELEDNNEKFNEDIINQELSDIKSRLSNLETKSKEHDILIPKQKMEFIYDDSPNKDQIDLIKKQIITLSKKIEEFRIQKDEIKKKIEDISIKVLDFNIIEILKKVPSGDGAPVEADKLLSLNLEQKFQKKSHIMDEKFKKNEEIINNMKNHFDNIKNNFEVIEQNYNGTKNSIKDLREEIIKSNIDYRNLITELSDKLNESFTQKIDSIKRDFNKNIDKIRQQIKSIKDKGTLLEDLKDTNKFGKSLSDNDLQYITDLSKKITDLEKQFSTMFRNIELFKTKYKEDLSKSENDLNQKVNKNDFFELNDKINLQKTISNNLRDMMERVQDLNNKNMKDLNFFLRKIESLSGSVVSMQNVLETLTGMKQDNQIELNSFMTQESFSKFTKIYQNDKKALERSIEEFRRVINDFTEVLKYKAGENDLKNFEALVMNKIEELKMNCSKKFADKIDTSKSFKYLDAQIKYISEIFVKRGDKNDSWLLAKKPVGGFSCASCESYIGELKNKGDYIAWNKYPQRERTNDKNYRVGNGFSRMLKMLNIDLKNSGDLNMNNSFESDDELDQNQHIPQNSNNNVNLNLSRGLKTSASYKNRSSLKKNVKSLNNVFSQNNLLPKINSFDGIINSESIVENFSDNKTNESPKKSIIINEGNKVNENADKKPHIVKVFRKNK